MKGDSGFLEKFPKDSNGLLNEPGEQIEEVG